MQQGSVSVKQAIAAAQNVKEREYWHKILAGEPPRSHFSYDYEENSAMPRKMESLAFRIADEPFNDLLHLANHYDFTLYMILVAGLIVVLDKHSYAGSGDFTLGAPIYKQETSEDFINTVLPLRIEISGQATFKELLLQVKDTVVGANKHQNFPIESILEFLDMPSSGEKFPLFDIAVLLSNIHEKEYLRHIPLNMVFSLERTGTHIEGTIEYNASLYRQSTVGRLAAHFVHALEKAISGIDTSVCEIDVLSQEEKHRLLIEFNQSAGWRPSDQTIQRLFAEQAERIPHHTALVGARLRDADSGLQTSITYKELNEHSDRLAQILIEKEVNPDTIVGIMVERCVEMVSGILAILKAGGAYLPIDPVYPQERIDYMLADSGAALLLTTESTEKGSYEKLSLLSVFSVCSVVKNQKGEGLSSETRVGAQNVVPLQQRHLAPATTLAYVIYTSGSTGKPKGAAVQHGGVVNMVRTHRKIFGEDSDSRMSQVASISFDAMAFETWPCLSAGAVLCIADNQTRLDPALTMQWLIGENITISFQPTQMAVQLLELARPQCTALKALRAAGDRLAVYPTRAYPFRFYNLYGPTEDTVWTTWTEVPVNPDRGYHPAVPAIGKPVPGKQVYILNSRLDLQPIGAAGELCIAGSGLARGYLNNPQLTAERFYYMSHRTNESNIPGKLYRTGDLARWLYDGNIEFLGRIDQQVKVRGFRIELGEIEKQLLAHEAVKDALVIDSEDAQGEKYLCAYIVKKALRQKGIEALGTEDGEPLSFRSAYSPSMAAELREYLSRTLPDYMVPSYFVTLEAIPLTPNGKVDRKALPKPGVEAGAEYIAPRDDIERKLAQTWSEILGIDGERIGADADFFQLGGHSLKAALLVSKIHEAFDVRVLLKEIFGRSRLMELARHIKEACRSTFASIEPVERREYYPLSSAQRRLFLLQQMSPGSIVYNMPIALIVEGEIQREKLADIFWQLVKRHESLRTSFETVEKEPVQKIHEEVEFEVEYFEAGTRHEASYINAFIRPFDLSLAPLIRVGLAAIGEKRHLLILDMHHTISDGISLNVLVDEFAALYKGETLNRPMIQYKDYAQWQNRELAGEAGKRQEAFWLGEFAGEIPVLELPYDWVRPRVQSFAGSIFAFEIGSRQLRALYALAEEEGATLFMVLLALYNIFLSKLSGQEAVVVGIPTAGRRHSDLSQTIGMFINTLALKNEPVGEKSVRGFIREVKRKSLEAFENQDYQYDALVEKLTINRDLSRNPLFDTMLVLQNIKAPHMEVPGLKIKEVEREHTVAKFDLMLTCIEGEEDLSLVFEYCTDLFSRETVERFAGCFERVAAAMTIAPDAKIAALEIVSDEEKEQLLIDFNRTEAPYPRQTTVHRLIEAQVERLADHICVVDPDYRHAVTYREMNRRANRLARLLREQGVGSDSVVGLMTKPGTALTIGILAILEAGGAYLPINPATPGGRVEYILADSAVSVLLADNDSGIDIAFNGTRFNLADDTLYTDSSPNPGCDCRANNLAYVIYTSGSTGRPKGVGVEHRQLVNFCFHMYHRYDGMVDFNDRCLSVTNMMFDVSVWEFFLPLVFGARLVHLAEQKRFDVFVLSEAILDEGITMIYLPPGLLKEVHRQLGKERQRVRLAKMLVGVEPIRDEVLEGYMQLIPHLHIINGYGPTETTICASSLNYRSHQPTGEIVPIGVPLSNNRIVLLDSGDQVVPRGTAGEICISGAGVSRGYLNNPELTAEKYTPHPYFKGERMYRSGDMGQLLPDGNIRFIQRRDQQLKIRGFRIEPGEIENRLLKHKDVRQALVLAKTGERVGKYLCAYIISDIKLEPVHLREYLARDLPDYMIPSYFVQLEQIPLTANGKVDKKALPEPEIDARAAYVAPRDDLERKLAEIWSEVLALESSTPVGIHSDFFELGGHSLTANIAAARIHKACNVKVPLTEIFVHPTIRELARYIESAGKESYAPIVPVEKREYYPLSAAQKRLYLLQQMGEVSEGTAYNIPALLSLTGHLDRARLEGTFRSLMQRHESLCTSFHMIEELPVQRVHDNVNFEIEYYNSANGNGRGERRSPDQHTPSASQTPLSRGEQEIPSPGGVPAGRGGYKIIDDFIRPFDLAQAPLLRVGLVKEAKDRHLLMVDMHHIVSDGTSTGVLVEEFMTLYDGRELTGLRLQYRDYADWQQREQSQTIKQQEEFWLKEFAGEVPVLELPGDYMRPRVQDFSGNTLRFELEEGAARLIHGVAAQEGATLFMVLLAVYNILLAKLSGQETIVVGTPTAGRPHADLERLIGMFVNTLALKNEPVGVMTFRQFLNELKERILAAFENQDFQYEELVDKAAVTRDTGRNPLFDTMFTLQNIDISGLRIPGLQAEPYEYESRISKFDLLLQCSEDDGRLLFSFEYCTKLFREETIERFGRYFEKIAEIVSQRPDEKIGGIEIISEEEREQVLFAFNDIGTPYAREKTIHELFEAQAGQRADGIALVGAAVHLTYAELNRKADRLADVLQARGIGPGFIAALMVERSFEMIMGILGILKSGGAYLPIDPASPAERFHYILADSDAKILLTTESTEGTEKQSYEKLSLLSVFSVCSVVKNEIVECSSERRLPEGGGGSLAYVIYTSGSTGMPKGVFISHANFSPLVHWGYRHLGIGPQDRTLQNLAYYFDWSVFEIFITLTSGAALYIAPSELLLNPEEITSFINSRGLTVLHVTPTQYRYIVDTVEKPTALKHLFIGAEKLTHDLVERSFASVDQTCQVFNMYGPTECAIISATLRIERGTFEDYRDLASVPIGIPSGNTGLYILDKYMRPCPIKIAGELFIGGNGVSCGYMNRPELTAERFIAAPAFGRQPQLYRTGDLCCWLPDGNVEFLGRIDQQVKIRGFRIEPAEIENRLAEHRQVKEALVMVRESKGGEKFLCAYIVTSEIRKEGTEGATGSAQRNGSPGEGPSPSELREFLSAKLPDYMIPSLFVQLEQIPLNPNGKVDTRALPMPVFEGKGEDRTGPRSSVEKRLLELWSRLLDVDEEHIGIDTDFFELGGNSLKGAQLTAQIHRIFQVKIALGDIFKTPTIRGVASVISNAGQALFSDIERVEERGFYERSYNPRRLWRIAQLEPDNAAYNMPLWIDWQGQLDEDAFKKALQAIICRHESLRTGFTTHAKRPVQFVVPKERAEISFQIIDLSTLPRQERERRLRQIFVQEAGTPFDLSKAPLFRCLLVKIGGGAFRIIFNMHHIISDGMSQEILKREFAALYEGYVKGIPADLAPAALQYKDFAVWQDRQLKEPAVKERSHSFWKEILARDLDPVALPVDSGADESDRRGAAYRCVVPAQTKDRLNRLARANNSSLFGALLALFDIVLARVSGQEDILVGIPVSGRDHASLQNVVGFFVNTVILDTHVENDTGFENFLKSVNDNLLEAFQHQGYPLEMVLDDLNMKFPRINVFFNMVNLDNAKLETDLDSLESYHAHEEEGGTEVKFDLIVYITEYRNGIELLCNYKKALFSPDTIASIMAAYLKVIEFFSENPDKSILDFQRAERPAKRRTFTRR